MKPGDVVCLKSGSVRMTVECITKTADKNEIPVARVAWMTQTQGGVSRDQFPVSALLFLEDGDLMNLERRRIEHQCQRGARSDTVRGL